MERASRITVAPAQQRVRVPGEPHQSDEAAMVMEEGGLAVPNPMFGLSSSHDGVEARGEEPAGNHRMLEPLSTTVQPAFGLLKISVSIPCCNDTILPSMWD